MKKIPRDIIILHKCAINENHMMYGSCHMKHNRQNFLSFWAIFCPFTQLTVQKIKFKKKNKKTPKKRPGDTIILLKRTKNHDHMLYCS